NPIVYFSFEFGLHQSLPIYSGGLGVLSGDTVKEASDLDLPYIAIGFLYHQGYFKQKIQPHGIQEAEFPGIRFNRTPIFPLLNKSGDRLKLSVKLGDDDICVQVWYVKLANNVLYLMDTDLDENKPWFRGLSARLYGGDHEMRINQEILLAFAGTKLLEELSITPSIWHLNEGHCAFLSLKRLENLITGGKSFDEALIEVKKSTVFTTHTPVPAGHDVFGFDTLEAKFLNYWEKLGISREKFLALGMETEDSNNFNMTVLAMNTSNYINGVSKLHTQVTKKMWKNILKKNPESILVDITNGVHTPTWISGPMRRLYSKYVSEQWMENHDDPAIWDKLVDIPNVEYWQARVRAKRDLFAFIRETARKNRRRGTKDAEQLLASGALLDPEVLTIGFARRFATYKRANLIFRDIQRIRNILNNTDGPVQIIFAGKSHPSDEPGKQVLKLVYEQALSSENRGRIAFIENYDMHIGRLLVQGVDVWLNTPIRPHEASGTSGMKAAMNGIPHFSISDGWWAEGYNGKNGWVIGDEVEFESDDDRDNYDANSLYQTLEERIIPLYYDRDYDGIPHNWIKVSKETIRTSIAAFSARRMLKDYITRMYNPAIENFLSP
ncbi:MAG: alpha-glucan family phosphorylase, partial [Candidatus Heimdallarchaeota archaeon]|nr:alpha-glucan family phosphorylase [Candidatus Heimdallarchaeota archaeon]